MLIALLGAGNGLLNALMSNAGDSMSNVMTLWPGYRSIPYEGQKKWSGIKFDERDVEFVGSDRFRDNVDEVYGRIMYSDTLTYGKNTCPVRANGVNPLTIRVNNEHLLTGRFINEKDIREMRKVMVIGQEVAEELCDKDLRSLIGKDMRVGDLAFRVVGILAADETNGGSTHVYMPLSTVSHMRQDGYWFSRVGMSFHGLETVEDNEQFEASLRQAMNFRHNAAPQDKSTMYISNRFTNNMSVNKAISLIRLALWVLGIFTLLSGIVGVSNIMLITVKERIHEFGIRKALGATPWSIMALIVVESVCITAVFGYVGMLAGLFANHLMDITLASHPVDVGVIQIYMFKNPSVGIDVALEATLMIIIAGTIAGILPALKAARVRPIEALRQD